MGFVSPLSHCSTSCRVVTVIFDVCCFQRLHVTSRSEARRTRARSVIVTTVVTSNVTHGSGRSARAVDRAARTDAARRAANRATGGSRARRGARAVVPRGSHVTVIGRVARAHVIAIEVDGVGPATLAARLVAREIESDGQGRRRHPDALTRVMLRRRRHQLVVKRHHDTRNATRRHRVAIAIRLHRKQVRSASYDKR